MARLELALPMAGLLLAACGPAASKDAPTAPISPASVPAKEPGKCDPVKYAAALGVPTPVPADTPLSPRMKEINYRVLACLELSEPEKAAFRQEMVLRSAGLAATPQARGPEQGQGGGLIPTPFATPRTPEITSTIAITLPDGTKATTTLPPFTATLAPTPTETIARVMAVPSPTPDAEFQTLYGKVTTASKFFTPNHPENQPAWEKQMRGYLDEISLPNSPTRGRGIGMFWGVLGSAILATPQKPDPFCDLGRAFRRVTKRPPYSTYLKYDPKDDHIGEGLCDFG